MHPGPVFWVVPPQLASELADSLPEMAASVFQNNKLKLDFETTKFLKSLGSPRTSLDRKALGYLMGIIRWLILYG